MSENLLNNDAASIPLLDQNSNELPEDIGMEEEVPFYKQDGIRIWIYVLGGSIAVFVIIFILLSKQSTFFKGSTLDATATTNGDEQLFFGDYGATTTNNSAQGSSTTSATPPPTTTSQTDDQLIVDTPTTDTGIAFDPADLDTTQPVDIVPEVYDEFSDVSTLDANIEQDLFGAGINNAGELSGDFGNEFSEPGLNTNTSMNVMQAPNVQGDTGPGVWLAMTPTLLYVLYRGTRKKLI